MTDDTLPFPSGFPLYEFPDLTEEILFAYHLQIDRFIYLNAAFERVWHMPRANIISGISSLADTIHKDDRTHVTNAISALQKEKQKQKVEFRIQPPGREPTWIRLNAYISQKGNTEVIVGIANNITAEKKYSDTLHKFNEKKNSILHILSHDLLGPLGNIQLAADLLAENSLLKEDESVMHILNLISASGKRSANMIKDLISAEFLQTSESAFVTQRVDLVAKMTEIMTQYQQSPKSVPQRFQFATSCQSLYINVDEAKFLQAINNLLSNALKFTPDDGNIEVSLTESVENKVLITIKDSGIGIPEAMQPFLFDRFTKARRAGINGEPTNGLGMSIIKTIVEWHKGRIWFDSVEGKGTVFYVEIPKDL